jgi:hypothetical protein
MLLSLKEKSKDVVIIAYYVDINHHFDAHQVEELYLTSPKYISHRNSGIVRICDFVLFHNIGLGYFLC